MPPKQLARGSSKAEKRTGARPLEATPLSIRSSTVIGAGFKQHIRRQLARRLEHASGLLERVTVRFEDVNGPKGGTDTVCRIKAVISGRPSLVVAKRAASYEAAFAQAATALGETSSRTREKHGLRQRVRPYRPRSRAARPARPAQRARAGTRERDAGELIGRRVGHGPEALARTLQRPEKHDRAAYVDTAAAGVSASDRRVGGHSTARRNTLARTTRATAMLEDSRTQPSRKSTRRSANRGKPSQAIERAVAARQQTPAARASRRG